MRPRVRIGALVAVAALATCGGAAGPPQRSSGGAAGVLEHHGGPRRDGVYVDPTLTAAAASGFRVDPAFDGAVAGPVYAQPLYVPGAGGKDLVVVATERNEVVALDARTGKPAWTRKLGDPVPLSKLPCGNIDPLGATGTPVVDGPARTLYLDAMTTPDGGATKKHLVFALSLDDGATRPGWPVAPADVARGQGLSFDDAVQNERGALALVAGTLYVPFGGHWGDCGDFHGWVFAIPTATPSRASAWATPAKGGGIWGPSGVSSDGRRVFASTGNTFGARTWGGGEAVVAFDAGKSVAGGPADHFAPKDWQDLDEADTDIGGTGPIPVDVPGATPSALVVALGKDGKIYLLDRAKLGGIGGQVAVAKVARGAIITAAAAYTTSRGTYVVFRGTGEGCPSGQSGDLTAVRIVPGAPPSAAVAWCARQEGKGSPMVTTTDGRANAIVWSVGAEGDGKLHGFDGDTGRAVFASAALGDVVRFQTPILGAGRIYVATQAGVKALAR